MAAAYFAYLMSKSTRATKMLEGSGVAFTLHTYEYDPNADRVGMQAAEALGDARVVGVTAGASAPEDLVQAVIARLAPTKGVETVHVTEEDEYFPPPRELRELAARMGV